MFHTAGVIEWSPAIPQYTHQKSNQSCRCFGMSHVLILLPFHRHMHFTGILTEHISDFSLLLLIPHRILSSTFCCLSLSLFLST